MEGLRADMEPVVLTAVIAALALVQSVFGVGLLVLGTPLVLIAGVPFERALWLLLPASLAVSALQVLGDPARSRADARLLLTTAAPSVLAGMLVAFLLRGVVRIEVGVAGLLVAAALLRVWPRAFALVRHASGRHTRAVLVGIGFLHGLTNMGGSLLPAFAAARHSDKRSIRCAIASAYLLFVSVQLVVLAFTAPQVVTVQSAWTPLVAATVFLTTGRRTFAMIGERRYGVALSALMLVIAFVLVGRGILVR